jgi:hypothetical protein
MAAEALRKRGHEVVPFRSPVSGEEVFRTYTSLISADGNFHNLILGMSTRYTVIYIIYSRCVGMQYIHTKSA